MRLGIHRHERGGKIIAGRRDLLRALRRWCVDSRKLYSATACKMTTQRRRVKALGCKTPPLCVEQGTWPIFESGDNSALRGRWRLSECFFEGLFERNKTYCASANGDGCGRDGCGRDGATCTPEDCAPRRWPTGRRGGVSEPPTSRRDEEAECERASDASTIPAGVSVVLRNT